MNAQRWYEADLVRETGETLSLTQRDKHERETGLFYTEYVLHSPVKGLLLKVKIQDRMNHSFIAW